jgi:hypothetical protein
MPIKPFQKYRSVKTIVDNIKFDSNAEAKHYKVENKKTHSLEKCTTNKKGDNLIRAITYKADFVYFDNTLNKTCIVDTKGFETKDYILKRKFLLQSLRDKTDTLFIEVK